MRNKEKTIEFLNTIDKNQMIPLILGSLISSDTLINEDSCNKSIEIITEFLEVIDETEIENKTKWKEFLTDSLKIVERDKNRFIEERLN